MKRSGLVQLSLATSFIFLRCPWKMEILHIASEISIFDHEEAAMAHQALNAA